MIFGSKGQKTKSWIVAASALGVLALGITSSTAALPGNGKFHIKAVNSEDESVWGIYPKLTEPGEDPETPGETPAPTPDPTPEPTPEPTEPPVTTPPTPEPDNMIFTVDLSAAGCTSTTRSMVVYGVKTDDVKLISPSGRERILPKATSAYPSSSNPTDESGKWILDGEYERVTFSGNNCLTEVNQWQGSYVNSANSTFLNTKNLRIIEDVPTQITNMSSMLSGSGFNGDVSDWKTSKVTDMSSMFYKATNFEGRGVENFDTSNVTSTRAMFQGATVFNGDLGTWDMSKVENTVTMFHSATAFEGKGLENWDTRSLTDMNNMFIVTAKFDADLGSWDVSKVTNFTNTFTQSRIYTGKGLENWDVSSATTMTGAFSATPVFNGKIGAWGSKVAKIRNIASMLQGASAFDQDLSGWMLCSGVSRSNWATGSKIASNTALHPNFNRVCS